MKKYMLFMSLLMALGLIASEDSSDNGLTPNNDSAVALDAVVGNEGSDFDDEPAPTPPPRKNRPNASVVQEPVVQEDEEAAPPVPPRKSREVQINNSNDVNGGGGSAVDGGGGSAVDSDNRLVNFLSELFKGSPELENLSEFTDFKTKSSDEQAEILVTYAENNKLDKKQLQDLVGIVMRKQLKIEFAKKIDLIQRLCKLNFDEQLFNKIENWLNGFEYHDNFTLSRDQKDIAIPKSVFEWKSALISFYNLNLKIFTNKLEIEKNALDGLQNQLNALPLGEEPADLDSAEGKVYKTAQEFHKKTQASITSKSEEVQYLNNVVNELTVNIEKLSQEQSVAEQSETIDSYRDTKNPVVVCLIAAFDQDKDIDMSEIVTFLKNLNLKSNNYKQWEELINFSKEQKNKHLDAMIDAYLLDSTINGGLSENEQIMLRYELYKLIVQGLETVLQKLETGDKFTGDEKEVKRTELTEMLEASKSTFKELKAKYPSKITRLSGWLGFGGGGKK